MEKRKEAEAGMAGARRGRQAGRQSVDVGSSAIPMPLPLLHVTWARTSPAQPLYSRAQMWLSLRVGTRVHQSDTGKALRMVPGTQSAVHDVHPQERQALLLS